MSALPVASPWYAVDEVASGVHRITEPHCHRLVRANAFLIAGRDADILVDTGMAVAPLRPVIASLTDRPLVVVTTHAHGDHVGGHGEFRDAAVLVHPLEADILRRPGPTGLRFPPRPAEQVEALRRAGIELTEFMADAVPHAGYDPDGYGRDAVEPTRLVGEGDTLDTGDRRFSVLHLPGHSPGGIALWEPEAGWLFSGDVIYDGVLVDTGPGADVVAYRDTMARLMALPVRTVFGGHNATMDGGRMREIATRYLASRRGVPA